MQARSITPSSICSEGSRARNWSASAHSAARKATLRAPRTATMSISPPARSASAWGSPHSPPSWQDYVRLKGLGDGSPPGRMVAVMGDAEIDEGNIFEAMLEGWKHDVRNLWWIIDYNRQSLDSVVTDRLFRRFDGIFRAMGWQVHTLKYGETPSGGLPETGRQGSGTLDRRLPELPLLGPRLQGRGSLERGAGGRPRPSRRNPQPAEAP